MKMEALPPPPPPPPTHTHPVSETGANGQLDDEQNGAKSTCTYMVNRGRGAEQLHMPHGTYCNQFQQLTSTRWRKYFFSRYL